MLLAASMRAYKGATQVRAAVCRVAHGGTAGVPWVTSCVRGATCAVHVRVQISLVDTGTLEIGDAVSGACDSIDFSEPVDAFATGHGRLVVATGAQVRVYRVGSGAGPLTPSATVDVHEPLTAINISSRCFMLLLASSGPQVRCRRGQTPLQQPRGQHLHSLPLYSLQPRTRSSCRCSSIGLRQPCQASVRSASPHGGQSTRGRRVRSAPAPVV
jgi:hypothetical protein